eukprot:1058232-Amphidinium_carterae.1
MRSTFLCSWCTCRGVGRRDLRGGRERAWCAFFYVMELSAWRLKIVLKYWCCEQCCSALRPNVAVFDGAAINVHCISLLVGPPLSLAAAYIAPLAHDSDVQLACNTTLSHDEISSCLWCRFRLLCVERCSSSS